MKALIIRLPGLFGKNIKKNYIYDYINLIPSMLKEEKFRELAEKEPELKNYYNLQDNGFYKVNVSAGEVYKFLSGKEFKNELRGLPADYDYRTIYSDVFAGNNGYISDKEQVLNEIKEFVES